MVRSTRFFVLFFAVMLVFGSLAQAQGIKLNRQQVQTQTLTTAQEKQVLEMRWAAEYGNLDTGTWIGSKINSGIHTVKNIGAWIGVSEPDSGLATSTKLSQKSEDQWSALKGIVEWAKAVVERTDKEKDKPYSEFIGTERDAITTAAQAAVDKAIAGFNDYLATL